MRLVESVANLIVKRPLPSGLSVPSALVFVAKSVRFVDYAAPEACYWFVKIVD